MADRLTHDCPANECERQVASHMLMCGRHWRMVPQPLRRAVWAAWRNGAGAGTPEHRAAIRRAIEAVNRG